MLLTESESVSTDIFEACCICIFVILDPQPILFAQTTSKTKDKIDKMVRVEVSTCFPRDSLVKIRL